MIINTFYLNYKKYIIYFNFIINYLLLLFWFISEDMKFQQYDYLYFVIVSRLAVVELLYINVLLVIYEIKFLIVILGHYQI